MPEEPQSLLMDRIIRLIFALMILIGVLYGTYLFFSILRKDRSVSKVNRFTLILTAFAFIVLVYLNYNLINSLLGAAIFMLLIRVSYVLYSDTLD